MSKRGAGERHVWSKFFWSDWRGDAKLGMCSYAARGFWMECLALMAESSTPGHLLVAGKAPDLRDLARLTRGSVADVRRCLEELTRHGVCSWTDTRVLFSRRMVRDAARAARNRENGQHGGSPVLLDIREQKSRITDSDNRESDEPDKPQKPEARSKSQITDGDPAAFEEFWRAYPRKVARKPALAEWKRVNPTGALTAVILAGLDRAMQTRKWQQDMREPDMPHIPHPRSWLHQRRWEDELERPATAVAERVDADVRRVCEAAGLKQYDIHDWFAGAALTRDSQSGRVQLALATDEVRDYVIRNFSEALEAAVITLGGSQLTVTAITHPD